MAHKRIVQLNVSNIKRVSAVEIKPDGRIVNITGKNRVGKTSILDSISLLFSRLAKDEIESPLKDGEDKGSIVADLGDVVATKTYRRKGDETIAKITLKNKDGSTYDSPQTRLTDMSTVLSFDPSALKNMVPEDQVKALIGLIGKGDELALIDKNRKSEFENRTNTNRRLKDSQGALKALGDAPDIDGEPVELSIADTMRAVEDARNHNDAIARRDRSLSDLETDALGLKGELEHHQGEVEWIEKELAQAREDYAATLAQRKAMGDPIDTDAMTANLATVESHNTKVRALNERQSVIADIDARTKEAEQFTASIARLDADKRQIISDADMPVEGLSFDDNGITLNGVHIKDWSSAEEIETGFAMAVAANPELRLIIIKNGSLLDTEARKLIAKMADEHDFHVWIETVDESAENAIVIVDGQVAA